MRAILAIALVACSIPALDPSDKHCPCAAGYTCQTVTNVCVAGLVDGGPPVDGATRDVIYQDAPGGCFGATGAVVYQTDFTTFTGWTSSGGTWSVSGGEAIQSNATTTLAFAYPSASTGDDYGLLSHMRQTSGNAAGAIEITFRIQASPNKGQYHCNWQPNTGVFQLQPTDTSGNSGSFLAAKTIDLSSVAGYNADMTITMEVDVRGSNFQCCLHEISGAVLSASDATYTTGGPGLKTFEMAAAFDDFVVTQ